MSACTHMPACRHACVCPHAPTYSHACNQVKPEGGAAPAASDAKQAAAGGQAMAPEPVYMHMHMHTPAYAPMHPCTEKHRVGKQSTEAPMPMLLCSYAPMPMLLCSLHIYAAHEHHTCRHANTYVQLCRIEPGRQFTFTSLKDAFLQGNRTTAPIHGGYRFADMLHQVVSSRHVAPKSG